MQTSRLCVNVVKNLESLAVAKAEKQFLGNVNVARVVRVPFR